MERKALSTCRLSAGVFGGWLLSLLALAPVPAAGQQLPIPELALWEAQMLSYGQPDCDYLTQPHTSDELLNHVYYDAERVFYQIADYTGNAAWTTCAQRAEAVYRDRYVLPNSGSVPGYWNFTHGLTMDYLRTGDVNSKNAVILLSQHAAYAADGTDLAWTVSPERSREVAYAIMSYINAEKVGAPPRTRLPQLVDQALGHIDQWFISKTYRCPSDCDPPSAVGQYYIQPFMVGLTAEALIMEYEKTGDSRILPALKTALDWLWANAWVTGDQAFWYDNAVANPTVPWPSRPGAPDLNLLIAPAYAWLYRQTGDTKYRDRGDQIFAGGVQFAFLGGGKQFDQNYKWSFDYVKWRTGPADTSPPTVTITAPPASASVAGILGVAASATDNVGVVGVQFRLDGANLGAEVTVAPYTVSWNTTTALTGAHTLTATARDATGNTATSASVTVIVSNPDLTPPTVAITTPPSGASVAGTITVAASATDNVGVVGVQFRLDGANLGGEATVAPYSVSWNTTTALNGTHILTAVARDAAGNSTASAGVSVTVVNGDATPPLVSITSPLNGATVSSVVTISAMASDNVGVGGVQFKLDGANLGAEVTVAPYTVSWNSTTALNGTHTLTAVARDAAGNSTPSAGVSVTVNNTPPTVSITAPAAGATVAATITVSASAASGVGVAGVQFQLDGGNLGAEVTVAPYAVPWDTTATLTGTRTLTAVARDTTGNRATSAPVSVTVNNTPPVLSAVSTYKYVLNIAATVGPTAVPAGYSVPVTFNHANLVSAGKSMANGNDVRVFYWNGATWIQLDRVLDNGSSWNTSTTRIWFQTQAPISPNASANGYYLYYGDPAAANPPANKINVFLFADDFESGALGKWTILSGLWQIASDRTHSGTYSLKYPPEAGVNQFITANPALNIDNVYVDAWWQFSALDPATDTPDIAQGLRVPAGLTSAYEVNLEGQSTTREGWDAAELSNGTWRLFSTDTLSTAAANTWTRIGISMYGTGMRVFKDGAQINPASGSLNVGTDFVSGNIGFRKYNTGSGSWWIDDVVVRRYVDPEPTIALGVEQQINTPPTVSIAAPTAGATVAGTITVSATATDNVGVVGVQFKLDDANLGAEVTAAPYTVVWNTLTVGNGAHTLTAVARDAAGNSTPAAGVSVTVSNDLTPPVVGITAPAAGATVADTMTVSATATDNVGVVGVQFKLDDANLGAEVTAAPYTVVWNTLTVGNGAHTLTAVARDAAGNSTPAAGVSVTVLNDTTPPLLSAVSASPITSADATITWTTNEASDTQIEYGPTTSYGSSTPLAPSLVTAHSQTLRGLAPNSVYHYRVTSRDGVGNVAVSGDFTFTTLAVDLVVYRTPTPITVDGVLNEWNGASAAQFSGLSNKATTYLLWDATNLYVAFYVTDTQLRALKRTRDASGLSADDTVEIYVDTLNDRATTMQPDDYQFLVNLNNVQGDLRGAGGWKDPTWNGIWKSAVNLQGTLNSNGHIDSGYIVEIAIPWAQIGVTPGNGLVLGMDFVVDDSDPASSVPFSTFDWAGITTGPYARPNLWKRIQLVDPVVTSP